MLPAHSSFITEVWTLGIVPTTEATTTARYMRSSHPMRVAMHIWSMYVAGKQLFDRSLTGAREGHCNNAPSDACSFFSFLFLNTHPNIQIISHVFHRHSNSHISQIQSKLHEYVLLLVDVIFGVIA